MLSVRSGFLAYAPFATKLRAATVLLLFVTLLIARASFSNPPTPAAAEGTVPTATATPISASALTPTPEPTVPTAPQAEDDAPTQSGGLFSQIEGDPPPSTDVETLAGRLVGIDFGQLAQVTKPTISPKRPAASKPQRTLVLNLFDDVVFTGIVEHVEPTASGHALWGRLDGVELGTMTLVVNGSVVVGTVRTPDAVYSIRTAGNGTYVIRQIDESTLPPLGEPLEVTLPSRDASAEVDDFPPDDGSEIDVMVVYTPLAKHREGGRAAIEALIELFVAETNQAYANSGVIHRIRLVLREEVDYLETGNAGIDLARLSRAFDEYMNHIHELRDLYAADLVHIVVGVSDLCGRASGHFNESQGFALTAHYCVDLTFAHELGHNFGLSHDRYAFSREYPEIELGSEANYGYVNQRMFEPGAPASARWRTIMAYPTQCVRAGGCRRIPYFSNPDNTFSGDPMGVPADHPSTGVDGPADAVGTLNKRREFTANFRPSSTSPTPRVGLALSQYWLSETGGHATVTATLHRLSRTDTIVTVSASSVDAVALSSNRTLTIPAGQTVSVGTVTITGVDNDDQTGDVSVNVSATVANTSGQGVIKPRPVELVIVDNETTPKVTLSLSHEEIYEIEGSLGQTLVTATLDNRSSERVTVTVSASPNEAVFVNWPTQLTIPAGQAASDRFVVIEAVRDFEFTGSKKGVMVSGDASSSLGITGPESVKLTIIDTDAPIFLRDSGAYIFKAGVAASRPLPRAAFGNGLLTYSMTPDPSNEVTFSPGPPARIGASSTSARDSEAIYTLTATDAEGDTDTMKISIAVAEGVCPDSTAVLGYRNMGIATDCEALLESKNILRGDRSLNWRMHRSVGKWQGVSIVDDRVVEMDMSYLQLSGAIPTELGNLSSLESLDLSNNYLTGPVPSEMINLSNLEHLYLKGNRLSGCVPVGLRNVPHNDLDAVRLPNCAGPTTPTIPQPPKVGQAIPGTATGLLIVEWRAPLSDGGSDIIAYDMRYIETSSDKAVDSNWKEVQNVWTAGGGAFSYQLAGLTNDTEYDLQVRAVNLEGDGPWSIPVTGTPLTPSACVTEGAVADAKTTGLVSDCEILLEARDTLSGSATLNWTVDTPIAHWNGVRLDERLRRVTVLNLRQLGLGGSLPSEISGLTALEWLALHDNDLTGPIPRELGSLPKLRRLWLSGNRLTGEIPAELGQLTNLQGLYLEQNRLTGQIPRELGNLAKLRDLYLDANQLTGEIPGELGNLTNLERLFLYSNQLTGEIPAELGNLNNLEWLYLNNNQLTQEIPAELGNLNNLEWLYLSFNNLTGEIPAELGNLHYLKRLHLDTNQLSGTIPVELGNLSNLEKLFLQYNQLTGAIPAELGSLGKLELLILRGNLLSSCIPAGLQDVPTNDFSQLNLPYCEVTIPRAPRISQVITGTGTGLLIVKWDEPLRDGGSNFTAYDLRYIAASSDEVVDSNWKVVSDVWSTGSGTLNYQLTGLTEGISYDLQVRAVSAAGDGPWSPPFTGTPEPVSVCIVDGAVADGSNTGLVSDCETLLEIRDTLDESATLNWAANTPITEWDGVRFRGMPERVSELRLSRNFSRKRFSGKIPHEVGNLTSLRWLDLHGNRLTGEIPKELGNLTNLEVLVLSANQLFGEIPPELGNLADLQSLSLYANRLTGEIPPELGNLVSLQGLNLNANRLAGEIPSELGNLVSLQGLSLNANRLAGEIPSELGNLSYLQWLSLNGNQLTGKIPVELGYLGNLQRLYLSDNSVNGCIPAELQDALDHDLGSLGLPYCEVTTPLAPSISQVIHSTRTSILVVGWDAPLRDGGSDITAYDLRYIETDDETLDANWTVVQDVWTYDSDSLQYALTGLTDNAQYDIQLRAVNAVGQGPWSTTATGTTAEGSNCTTNSGVPVAASNPGLVTDCEALLEALDSLVGDGSLNWTTDTAITQWDGVGLSGTPQRVTRLVLSQEGLSGTIPAALGSLSMLTRLDLRTNQLTGEIPAKLGELTNLQELYLSGNHLTGCTPEGLRDVPTSDLDQLGLPFCDVLLDDLVISPGSLTPVFDPYRIDYAVLTSTSQVTVTPVNESDATFQFLDQNQSEVVDADRSLDGHQIDLIATVTTIRILVTSQDGRATRTYTVTIRRVPGASAISEVSSGKGYLTVFWTAPDETDGVGTTAYDLRYIQTVDDKTVDSNWTVVEDVWTTGSGALEYTLTGLTADTEYDLQVRAVNAVGDGPWSATVTATPTAASACVTGGAVSDAANTGLVSDCEALLAAEDILAVSVSLNWAEDTPIAQWDGIRLGGASRRVTRLALPGKGLGGTVPSQLGELSMLTDLNLRTNQLSGPIPAELGDLSSLVRLNLHTNQLSGPIPDLRGLTGLEEMYLARNMLTGPVPAWLNGMTEMRELWLWGNQLSGTIPDLSGMTSLEKLKLAANDLEGGVPEASALPTNLRWLIIQENPLGGTIPDLSGMSRMTVLWLHTNGLTGEVPASHLPPNLTSLNLHSNQLSGVIPDLSGLDRLQWLRLQGNQLSGTIPSTLGEMESLTRLWLHENMLSGSIPAWLGGLTKLQRLWLSDNMLSGEIPSELGELGGHSLVQWRLGGNALTGCVPAGLAGVEDGDLERLGLLVCSDS